MSRKYAKELLAGLDVGEEAFVENMSEEQKSSVFELWRKMSVRDMTAGEIALQPGPLWILIGERGSQRMLKCTPDMAASRVHEFYQPNHRPRTTPMATPKKQKLNITGNDAEEVIENAWSMALVHGLSFNMSFESKLETLGFQGEREVLLLTVQVGDWKDEWKFGNEGISNVMEQLSKMLPGESDQ